jgi:hypothetical protein
MMIKLLLLLALATSLAAANQRPNVILILADDLGAKELSCYAGKDAKTGEARFKMMDADGDAAVTEAEFSKAVAK